MIWRGKILKVFWRLVSFGNGWFRGFEWRRLLGLEGDGGGGNARVSFLLLLLLLEEVSVESKDP